jgi:sulfur-oxidizing protein SoxX
MIWRSFLLAGLCILAACANEPDTLITENMIVGDTIPAALTETPGRIETGRAVFANREIGHCVLCHQVTSLDAPFQGNLGPNLDNVGDRLSAAQLRLRIVDYQRVRPGTVMPSYYRTNDLYQVGEDYIGKPVLTAQQVEDLVAYMENLKD